MKATGIVRRIDDLGCLLFQKRFVGLCESVKETPLLTTLTQIDKFCWAIHSVISRHKKTSEVKLKCPKLCGQYKKAPNGR